MRVELLGLLTIFLGTALLFAPIRFAFAWMMVVTGFGAASALTLTAMGGASILVPSLFLVFFGMRVFMAYGEGQIFAAFAPRTGFLLFVLTLFGLATAFFLPRVFNGMTETMTIERSIGLTNLLSLVPLRPTSNNITQPVYALGGLVAFAVSFAFFRRGGTQDDLIKAMLITSVVTLSFALADIVTYFTRTEYLLGFVRTANYAMLTAVEKGGLKRISGAFPEASAFAGYSLVLFSMVASLWLDGVRPRATGVVAGLLLLALVLSTSATGLVGIAAILPVLFLRSVFWPSAHRPHPPAMFIMVGIAAFPLLVLLVMALLPGVADGISNFLNEMLFSKADSQSGVERREWNAAAYRTFLDTYGIGAGLGSARASSFILVLLSNVGVFGALLFALFITSVFLIRGSGDGMFEPERYGVIRAAKMGVLAVIMTASISATVYDLGLMIYLLSGAMTALALPSRYPAREHLPQSFSLERSQS